MSAVTVLIAAFLGGAIALRRERKMHRAALVADAFEFLFSAVMHCRTVQESVLNAQRGFGPPVYTQVEYATAFESVSFARGKLAAVAKPAVVKRLTHMNREGGPRFDASNPEARRELSAITLLLRSDLGVEDGATVEEIESLLFG
ncbi:hypothetical protein HQO25_03730 [Rhodococcus fascians]|nr:hypothetical protein [Rhodococcus fascians]